MMEPYRFRLLNIVAKIVDTLGSHYIGVQRGLVSEQEGQLRMSKLVNIPVKIYPAGPPVEGLGTAQYLPENYDTLLYGGWKSSEVPVLQPGTLFSVTVPVEVTLPIHVGPDKEERGGNIVIEQAEAMVMGCLEKLDGAVFKVGLAMLFGGSWNERRRATQTW